MRQSVSILYFALAAALLCLAPCVGSAGEAGAGATAHWSFQPVRSVRPPAVKDDGWCVNDVDRFIFEALRSNGLHPSPPASRAAFIRRINLAILGLPPSPEQVRVFENDARPDAYERLVDGVLASPHYGEQWAVHWLDLVHFAETTGFEENLPRPDAWPYRDWVIDAFNRDEPYTDFIYDQLAGDTRGVTAATGFLVAGADDKVKSPDPALTAMQRHDELKDIVNTTSTAFIGLTVACATCHNHKFDPITQQDFYRFKAIFAGVRHGERPAAAANRAEAQEKSIASLQNRLAAIGAELERFEPLATPGLAVPRSSRSAVNPGSNIDRFSPVAARFVRFTVLATNSAEPCIDELQIFSAGPNARNVALASAGGTATASSEYANNPKHKISHINDGLFGNAHSWISAEAGRGWVQIELPREFTIDRVVWGRDREREFADRLPIQYRIEVATEPGQWRLVADSRDRAPFGSAVVAAISYVPAGEPAAALARLKAEEAEIEGKVAAIKPRMIYAGVFEKPAATHRLYRGDPMSPREEVAPGAIEFLGRPLNLSSDAPESERRAALARWIASDKNPLTARVMVNRIWQQTFGEGLVSTPSDFGRMGTPPSDPDLLDFLASRFMEQGWSVKKLQRALLLSATFRQGSAPNPAAMKMDAGNRLLWRFAPRRLGAEAIRDSILAVSGKLDSRMGGPGYSAFVPNSNYVRIYEPKETFGPDDWRRMIYETKVRMEPDGTFGVFDCPDAGQVAPKRTRSTTPLQALNLMNGSFVLQQAGFFAERLRREAGDSNVEQARLAFRLAFAREGDAEEIAASVRLIEAQGLPLFCRAMMNANEFVFVN